MQESFTISGLIKLKKEGHFTWCNKGKKVSFLHITYTRWENKIDIRSFCTRIWDSSLRKKALKNIVMQCLLLLLRSKKLQQNLFCLFWDLLMTHEWVAKWVLKICHSYISFLLHARDVKFHELWTELRKTFFDASHINNFDSRLDYAKS